MAISERDCETARSCIRKPMYAIRREIVILPLFAVCDDGRACSFEPPNCVSNCLVIKRSEVRIFTVAFCGSYWSWDTTDRLGRYVDRGSLRQCFIVSGPHMTSGTIALWHDCTPEVYWGKTFMSSFLSSDFKCSAEP